MKKLAIFLSALVCILATGCSLDVKRIDHLTYEELIDTVLQQNIKLKNTSCDGYSYYLPKGVQLQRRSQYNSILQSEGDPFYLYVDIISYYHKVDNQEFEPNRNAVLSKSLVHQDKKGYIEINRSNDKYFVEFMYHYAKIETYVTEEKLESALTNMAIILDSIQFNDTILGTLVGEHVLDYKEETFNIFKPTRDEDTFLKYVEEYDTKYDDPKEEIKNEDNIDIDQKIE